LYAIFYMKQKQFVQIQIFLLFFNFIMVQELLDVGNESEGGKLELVVMHRPGNELRRLREDNLDELLYDGIPNIEETHRSHDLFSQYLRDHGAQVLYVRPLLLTTLSSSKQARHTLINGIIEHSLFNKNSKQ
jgi:arginine deiminase